MHPFPDKRYSFSEKVAIGMEFLNAFDMMDLIPDIIWFQKYSPGWKAYFFIALGVSALMLSFPIALTEDDEKDAYWGRCLSSFLTLVFTDISFAILRGYVLFYDKKFQAGFTFFLKNVVISIIRLILVCCGVKKTKRLLDSLRRTRDKYFWSYLCLPVPSFPRFLF